MVDVPSAEAVESVLASGKMLRSVLPLFPKKLIEEVWYRAGGIQDPTTITSVIGEMEDDLQNPSPRIYWDEERKPLLSMIRLGHIAAEGEKMSSTDEAVRVVARRRLALTATRSCAQCSGCRRLQALGRRGSARGAA